MAVIEVEQLRKVYRGIRGRQVAVDGLDLIVPRGGVFGFLGPNGSGKTTTIRCLLGLIRPSGGRTALLGAGRGELRSVIGRVGSIVETPALFPTFTGRENLRLLGALDGVGPKAVDNALAQVGLSERAGDLVRKYSLGMKQRLALAATLLKDPEVLILDEPANGLDPAGIRDVRQIIRRMGDEGRTVFLSSHILSEIQQIADHVAILARGRAIASGPVREVLSAGAAAEFIVRARNRQAAYDTLAMAGFTVRHHEQDAVIVSAGPERAEEISRALFQRGVFPTELRSVAQSLEDVFLELTAEEP